MKKVLPFEYPTIVDTYSGVAGNVGAYMIYRKEYMPLLIANHFLITYSMEKREVGFNWEYYIYHYGYFQDIKEEAKENGVIDTIKKYITDNKYIRIILDFYYISNTTWYRDDRHLLHYIPQIIGFDDEEKCVYLVDNLCEGKYTIIKTPYKEIEEARKGHEDEILDFSFFYEKIDFVLSKQNLVKIFESWLDSQCYLERMDGKSDTQVENVIIGKKIYSVLEWTIEQVAYDSDEEYDIRTFHAIINHFDVFEIMLKEWIETTGYISSEFFNELTTISLKISSLCKDVRMLERLYIKFALNKNIGTKLKLLKKINAVKNSEEEIIKRLLEMLNESEENN